jgi:hypothetical protein
LRAVAVSLIRCGTKPFFATGQSQEFQDSRSKHQKPPKNNMPSSSFTLPPLALPVPQAAPQPAPASPIPNTVPRNAKPQKPANPNPFHVNIETVPILALY